ncbi:chemotaxis protein CheW [Geminicoccus flavidas]|uniref:chemotaxis protein CheW n=1 Tax=Geminicoccus flavidas TaxID=2506407 RepID=UPI00135917C4|nr:chemotaxis protein CheW [Geminicoccus flavidas]
MIHVVLFRVSSMDLALPLADVVEILPCPILQPLPGMAPTVGGVFRLEGSVCLALRTDRLLGLPERPPGLYSPLLRLRHADEPCALIVDEVLDVAAAPVSPPFLAHRSLEGVVTGQVEWAGRGWHLLDAGRLVHLGEGAAPALWVAGRSAEAGEGARA